MFGIGTLTTLLALSLMGPKLCICLATVVMAWLASLVISAYRARLSDATLTQDLALLEPAFDTDALLEHTPTREDTDEYYTRTTDRDYRARAWFVGPGLHTRLSAKHPIGPHVGTARQVMYVANEVAIAHHQSTKPVRVLELGAGRGYCTLLLAGLFQPASDFQFFGVDRVQRHVEVARNDALDYTNVHFRQGDAAHTSSFQPYLSTTPFDVVFAIEAVCHLDHPEAMRAFLTNTANHLAPDGRLILIDGFRSENFSTAPPDQQLAMRLAERAFSIRRMHSMSEWIEGAHAAGLQLKRIEDLTPQALPFWTLGWRVAHAVLHHSPAWVIRRLRASPYMAKSTDNLLAVATVAHAMRNRAAGVYGVMVFGKGVAHAATGGEVEVVKGDEIELDE